MRAPRPNGYRDTWCGDLTAERAGTLARVAGWVHRRRDHGGLIFIDLRDRTGIVQLVFHPENASAAHGVAHGLRSEYVISAAGSVAKRDPQNVNPNLSTGEIELAVAEVEVLAVPTRHPSPWTKASRWMRRSACGTAPWTSGGRPCRRRSLSVIACGHHAGGAGRAGFPGDRDP